MMATGEQQDLYSDGCWGSTGLAQWWLLGIDRICTVMAAGNQQDSHSDGCWGSKGSEQ